MTYARRYRTQIGYADHQQLQVSGRTLKSAISKLLQYRKSKKIQHQQEVKAEVIPHGKQTVKELIGQNQGVSSIDVADKDIKEFERITRKYGVDYAVHRAKGEKSRYVVFFKARDAEALNAAFEEFTQTKELKKEKPSIIQRLNKAKTQDRKAPDLVKNKKKELAR